MKFRFIVPFLLAIFSFYGTAQIELPEDKASWKFTLEQNGCEATVVAKIKVVEHWHIGAVHMPQGSFGFPTSIKLKKSPHFKLIGDVIEPKPILKYDELADEQLAYHEGTLTLKQKIKIVTNKDFELAGEFSFQPCDDVKCLRDYTTPFKLKVKGCTVLSDSAGACVKEPVVSEETSDNAHVVPEIKKKPVAKVTKTENKSLLIIFVWSFISGLLALFTPCVLPMVPMTVSFFIKQSKTKREGIRNALWYSLSIIVIYIVLGTLVTAVFGAKALNEMSTNPTFNMVFFLIIVVFAISFLGAFEIRMPSKWVNNVDKQADKGGLIGIFFMALALALVSFSCTGPIVGTLLVQAASKGGIAPFIGMFGFSLALALPFGLFAMFPGWMNSLPKSGGWLNTVKVVLGFLELALAFKFLSNADLAVQAHFLERELFLAILIGIFLALSLYLFGFIRLPHDSPLEKLSVGRTLLATLSLIFVLYMFPGLFGAPLKLISGLLPPLEYSESSHGVVSSSNASAEFIPGTHVGPQGLNVFDDYDLALAYAKKVNKPLFVDFTGHNCANCRKMEQSVWGEPGIIDVLKNDVVIASLHVDERKDLPRERQVVVEFTPGIKSRLKTTGDRWMYKQINEYKVSAQPFYVLQNVNGEDLPNGSADFENHGNPKDFRKWLEDGMKAFKK